MASFHQYWTHSNGGGILGGGALVEDPGGNLDANDIPVPIPKHDNKIVHHFPLGKDHDSKWLFGKHLNAIVL